MPHSIRICNSKYINVQQSPESITNATNRYIYYELKFKIEMKSSRNSMSLKTITIYFVIQLKIFPRASIYKYKPRNKGVVVAFKFVFELSNACRKCISQSSKRNVHIHKFASARMVFHHFMRNELSWLSYYGTKLDYIIVGVYFINVCVCVYARRICVYFIWRSTLRNSVPVVSRQICLWRNFNSVFGFCSERANRLGLIKSIDEYFMLLFRIKDAFKRANRWDQCVEGSD